MHAPTPYPLNESRATSDEFAYWQICGYYTKFRPKIKIYLATESAENADKIQLRKDFPEPKVVRVLLRGNTYLPIRQRGNLYTLTATR